MLTAAPKKVRWLMPLVYLLVFAFVWYWFQSSSKASEPKQISYSEFLSEVRAGHVSDVRIDERQFIAKLKTDPSKTEAAKEISTQRLPAMDETPLLKDLEAQGVTFSGHMDNNPQLDERIWQAWIQKSAAQDQVRFRRRWASKGLDSPHVVVVSQGKVL